MHKSFERIKQMVIKEFIQVLRDKRMKAIIFVIPVLQTLVFGFAVTTDVNNIPTAVMDLDNSFESRELVGRFASSGYFTIIASPADPAAVQELLDRATVSVAIQINRGFSADLKRNIPAIGPGARRRHGFQHDDGCRGLCEQHHQKVLPRTLMDPARGLRPGSTCGSAHGTTPN